MVKKHGWLCVDHGWTMVKHDSCRGILPPSWTWLTMNASLTMIIHVTKFPIDHSQAWFTMVLLTLVKHVLTMAVVYCRSQTKVDHGQTWFMTSSYNITTCNDQTCLTMVLKNPPWSIMFNQWAISLFVAIFFFA